MDSTTHGNKRDNLFSKFKFYLNFFPPRLSLKFSRIKSFYLIVSILSYLTLSILPYPETSLRHDSERHPEGIYGA